VKTSFSAIILLLLSTITGVLGQIFLKKGTTTAALVLNISHPVKTAVSLLTNPYILAWIAMAGISAVTWVKVVTYFELSFAFPVMMTLSFILILLLSFFFFGEQLTTGRWIGIALMVVGIFLASR
jgi:multidrug transporter EmrE-like cation transporter